MGERSLRPSSRGDRYQLRELLGRGGMGVVYAAFDQIRGETVALKSLLAERVQTPEQRKRVTALFEREYHALSQLEHPHIIAVYDYGLDEFGPYYTMERLSGASLRARAPMPWRQACAVMRDVVSALALLHSRSLIHRDLTPLNIHCPPDRPTKLLDFGAMMHAGLARQVVGTPAFTAPECLQQQSLDGQTDLYSVGACLYYAITGEPAYPARSFRELNAAFRTPPRPLSYFAPEVPQALDELVHALLSATREARPRTAAEVYERLTAIADLSRDEAMGSAQAYLTRPALVGRERELRSIAQAARAAASRSGACGSSLLVRAVRGLGRSRLLDAAVLEARLLGLRVARTDAASNPTEAFAAAHSLLRELSSETTAVLSGTDVEPEPESDTRASTLDAGAREQLLLELGGRLLALSDESPLALIVDDVHALDEPSRALLAMLAAQAHEHPLLLVCSTDADAAASAGSAAAVLAEYSHLMDLAELEPHQTRELVVSIVGEVPNVDVMSVLCHRDCRGNPRLLLESIETLIEHQVLRYEGGQWSLSDTPGLIEAALDRDRGWMPRLKRLSSDARELLEVIAFDEYQVLRLAHYSRLLEHRDQARMHSALSELVDSRWVELHVDRVRLARAYVGRALAGGLTPARRRELHARLAEHCADQNLPEIYSAHHLLHSEQPAAAIAALERFSALVEQQPRAAILREPITLTVTQEASQLPDFPEAHPAFRAKFMTATVLNTITYRGLPEIAARWLAPASRQMAAFSGVSDYAALHHLDEAERLSAALTSAAQRCASPGLGGLNVVEALRAQTRLCMAAALASHFMCDRALLDLSPDLTPFLGLSPVLRIAVQFVAALSKLVRGQVWAAWDALLALDRELSASTAQIDPLTHTALSGVVLAHLSALHADHGARDFHGWSEKHARFVPDHAESLYIRWHLAQGDIDTAAAARRRYEVLSVRMGSMSDALIMGLPNQLTFYALCDDSIGLRRTHAALQEVAKTRPGWQTRVELAHAHLLRCRGLASQALPRLAELMKNLDPCSIETSHAAATHLELLNAAQQWDAAAGLGRDYLSQARAGQQCEFRIELAMATACVELGRHAQAEELYAHAREQLEARDITGVLSGLAHQIGATIALARGDAGGFSERLETCGGHYRSGKHPALIARYNALRRSSLKALPTLAPGRGWDRGEAERTQLSSAAREATFTTSEIVTSTMDGLSQA